MTDTRPGRLLVAALLLVATGSLAFGGLAGDDPAAQTAPVGEVWVSDHVFRVVDDDADTVCYVGSLLEGAGISCLPLARTALGRPPGERPDVRGAGIVPGREVRVSTRVLRVVDGEAAVVCYLATLREGADVSCLPLARTALGQTPGPTPGPARTALGPTSGPTPGPARTAASPSTPAPTAG